MLEPIYIEAKEIFPKVILDRENGIFLLAGRSLPEDVDSFFNPVMNWLQMYLETPNPVTEFQFRLDYYNSATVRKIVDILVIMEKIANFGNTVRILWYYEDGDDIMKENGEDFRNVIRIPFDIIKLDAK